MSDTKPVRPLAVALDVNETLSDMTPLADRFEQVGAPVHLQATWFAGVLRDGFALTAAGGHAEFATVARAALLSLLSGLDGLKLGPAEAAEFVLSGLPELPLHPDVRPGLERMHASGIRSITLTNGSAESSRALLERGGAAGFVEQRLSVEAVGRWKPAPEPYLYAAQRCRVRPEQMMLVAVHPWDVDGARRAGLTTCWINRADSAYPEPFRPGDLECRDFIELADALARRPASQ